MECYPFRHGASYTPLRQTTRSNAAIPFSHSHRSPPVKPLATRGLHNLGLLRNEGGEGESTTRVLAYVGASQQTNTNLTILTPSHHSFASSTQIYQLVTLGKSLSCDTKYRLIVSLSLPTLEKPAAGEHRYPASYME